MTSSLENKTTFRNKFLDYFKYFYLFAFFALLSGFFYPVITGKNFDGTILGVPVLFVGLAGGVLLYKSAVSEQKRMVFLISGFSLIMISLFFIFKLSGRIY